MVSTRPLFCFVGFGTDRLRRQEAMKIAGGENPNHGVAWPRNRAHGAEEQNKSRSIKWAAKQNKFRPKEMFFLDFSSYRTYQDLAIGGLHISCLFVYAPSNAREVDRSR
jgi:hypothetical protein